MINLFFEKLAKIFPEMKEKLKQAGIDLRTEDFVKRTFISSFYVTTGIIVSFFLIFYQFEILRGFLFLLSPIVFIVFFFYLIKLPDIKISRREKEINKEIVFAGRYLIIELDSGVPLYNAMVNISKNFDLVGSYFKEIMDKVDLGTSMEDALNEAVEFIPSNDIRRILWQIVNSLRTGSDISKSVNVVLEQIVREQSIQVTAYGRKLNPLAMFYMIIAVIFPSLGITFLIIIATFVKLELSIVVLIFIAIFLSFVQFMFLSYIKFSRPPVDF